MESINKPNSKYKHAFAVVRLDDYGPEITIDPSWVMVPKVFLSEERANAEAERLNQLNGSKGVQYFVRLTRLDEAE